MDRTSPQGPLTFPQGFSPETFCHLPTIVILSEAKDLSFSAQANRPTFPPATLVDRASFELASASGTEAPPAMFPYTTGPGSSHPHVDPSPHPYCHPYRSWRQRQPPTLSSRPEPDLSEVEGDGGVERPAFLHSLRRHSPLIHMLSFRHKALLRRRQPVPRPRPEYIQRRPQYHADKQLHN